MNTQDWPVHTGVEKLGVDFVPGNGNITVTVTLIRWVSPRGYPGFELFQDNSIKSKRYRVDSDAVCYNATRPPSWSYHEQQSSQIDIARTIHGPHDGPIHSISLAQFTSDSYVGLQRLIPDARPTLNRTPTFRLPVRQFWSLLIMIILFYYPLWR